MAKATRRAEVNLAAIQARRQEIEARRVTGRPRGSRTKRDPAALTYSVIEVGKLLGIGRNQAYQAVEAGDVPSIRIGRRRLVLKAPFDRLLSGETD